MRTLPLSIAFIRNQKLIPNPAFWRFREPVDDTTAAIIQELECLLAVAARRNLESTSVILDGIWYPTQLCRISEIDKMRSLVRWLAVTYGLLPKRGPCYTPLTDTDRSRIFYRDRYLFDVLFSMEPAPRKWRLVWDLTPMKFDVECGEGKPSL